MLNSPVERVAERWNFRFHPRFDQSLGFRHFKLGVCHDPGSLMTHCVAANFVTMLDHAFEKLNVVCIPCDLAPIETAMFCKPIREYGVGIGNQEKCGWKTVLVKDADGSFKLTSQSVIES